MMQPKEIDWESVHRQLAAARERIQQFDTPPPGESARILAKRAAAYARVEKDAESAAGATLGLVTFRLASEQYGIEIAFVRGAYAVKDITPLPFTPPFVSGVLSIRGEIVSVIDLKQIFSIPKQGIPEFSRMIVVGNGKMTFGLLADEITGTRIVPEAQIRHVPVSLGGERSEYIRGIAGETLVVLDASRILSDRRVVVNDQI